MLDAVKHNEVVVSSRTEQLIADPLERAAYLKTLERAIRAYLPKGDRLVLSKQQLSSSSDVLVATYLILSNTPFLQEHGNEPQTKSRIELLLTQAEQLIEERREAKLATIGLTLEEFQDALVKMESGDPASLLPLAQSAREKMNTRQPIHTKEVYRNKETGSDGEITVPDNFFAPDASGSERAEFVGIQKLYTPKRRALHNRIIGGMIDALPPMTSKGEFVFLLGIPGAGKSSAERNLERDSPEFARTKVTVNPDEFFEVLYNEDLHEGEPPFDPTNHDHITKVREESSDVAKELLAVLLTKNSNILYQGTMTNLEKFIDPVKGYASRAKRAGFTLKAIAIFLDPREAWRRTIQSRQEPIPLDVLLRSLVTFLHINKLRKIIGPDFVTVFENTMEPTDITSGYTVPDKTPTNAARRAIDTFVLYARRFLPLMRE